MGWVGREAKEKPKPLYIWGFRFFRLGPCRALLIWFSKPKENRTSAQLFLKVLAGDQAEPSNWFSVLLVSLGYDSLMPDSLEQP